MSTLLDQYGAYSPQINSPPVDGTYSTPTSAGIPIFENGVQFKTGPGRMGAFYGNNSSNVEVYVLLSDTANGAAPAAGDKALFVITVPLAGFVTIQEKDGKPFSRGLYAQAYLDPALTTPAGNIMSWDVEWSIF